MCFSKQPKAPIKRPDYAPEDAHKHFTYEDEVEGNDRSSGPEEVTPTGHPTGPKIKPNHDSIRM